MSTLAQVIASLKARDAAQITMFGTGETRRVYWDKDAKPTDIDPEQTFVFFYVETDPGEFVSLGGGRGNNLQRVVGELVGLVHIPRDWGLEQHASHGEHVAAAFRSFRDAHVSCGAVTPQPAVDGSNLKPPGLDSEVENFTVIVVAVPFNFDQVG